MSRFEELQEKGWRNLDAAEREEYSSLKKMEETENLIKPANIPPKKETIEVTKDELKSMIQDGIQSYIKAANSEPARTSDGWHEEKESSDVKFARIKVYQEDTNSEKGLIVDWKFLKNEFNELTRKHDKQIYELTVKYKDREKKVNMELLDFTRIKDYEEVKILSTESKKMVKVTGKVRRAMQDKSGYTRSVFAGSGGAVDRPIVGDFVDEKVERIESFHKVQLQNGEILEINNSRLNA